MEWNLVFNSIVIFQGYHFDRDDVALHGISEYFRKCSEEENEHARKLMKYQNERGGRIVLSDIQAPKQQNWGTTLEAMSSALDLEKKVNESLLQLHSTGSRHVDVDLCDFLESHYLHEQVEAIKEVGDYVTNLKRVGEGLGVYMFDKNFSS